jgi:membrane protein DedA with SNARE-associated domain
MRELLDWLASLPDPLLYGAIVIAAFAENVFPPLPADTVIALGAFVAARGNGTALGVWGATMLGNIGGAMFMYWIGHRFGLPWLSRRFPALLPPDMSERFAKRFATQGMLAVVVSRFLPAVRAVVPPVAGALGIGALRAGIAMTVASGVWYGLVCLLAFRAGANAEAVLIRVAGHQRTIGAIAVGMALVVALVWWWRARSRRGETTDA